MVQAAIGSQGAREGCGEQESSEIKDELLAAPRGFSAQFGTSGRTWLRFQPQVEHLRPSECSRPMDSDRSWPLAKELGILVALP